MKLRLYFPQGEIREVEVAQPNVRLGRDPACEVIFDATLFPKVSGFHAELISKDGAVWLVHRSKSNSTVVRDSAIDKPVQLRPGDRWRLGFTGPEVEFLGRGEEPGIPAENAVSTKTAAGSAHLNAADKTVFSAKASDYLTSAAISGKTFPVSSSAVIGRLQQCAVHLEHPHVSRRHAQLKVADGRTWIADAGSSNGTFVNGNRIKAAIELCAGDVIDIGPYSLSFDGRSLVSRSRANNIRIDVYGISCVVPDPANKRPLHLLNDVSFSVEPGEFLCVIGPSGSGKSTLLGIVSGRNWPFCGQVSLNGRDLHRSFGALKEDLVVVPQTSALHESLTVWQTMGYVAELRLPGDTARTEINDRSISVLGQVGLELHADTRVSQLSGGQLKRLGLACELISDASLLFLDEVTSGLDELSDGEMMALFRQLADSGKTIVCVTHNLANVEKYCHRVLVLTTGGRVAFLGTPAQAFAFFDVRKLADVYAMLETRRPEQWSAAFLSRQQNQRGEKREEPAKAVPLPGSRERTTIVERVGLRPFRQWLVLTRRYLAVWRGDWRALLAMIGQAVLVTVLLCLVFSSIPGADELEKAMIRKTEIRNLLFLVGVSCLWLGANNATKEIVKERRIYQRERDFNLIPESFWASKIVVLGVLGTMQATMLTLTTGVLCDLPIGLHELWSIGVGLSFVGTNLGLAISANSRSEELAVALVPAVIIPQIILGGIVATLTSTSLWLAKLLITAFWGQKLLELATPVADRLPSDFEPTGALCLAALSIHCLLFMLATWAGVRYARSGR